MAVARPGWQLGRGDTLSTPVGLSGDAGEPGRRRLTTLFSLDADDTQFRGQSWCSADGIAAPTICVSWARSILKGVGAAVEIFRQPDYRRDRARAYRVLIDGEEVGRVKQGERIEFAVRAGLHTVELRIDWCRSPVRTLSIGEGDTVRLVCHPAGNSWTGLWDATVRRAQYIVVRAPDTAEP